MHLPNTLPLLTLLLPPTTSLKIATSLQWIEHTPQPFAIAHFYNGTSPATISSGGVATLSSDTSISLAANAETQGLKQYAAHRNLRLIYVICEVAYRIVADRRRGITTLKDLKGKKIGTIKGTSAGVFVHDLLSSAGVQDGEYTLVNGDVCMKVPCAADSLPEMLRAGKIDAFGVWEPAVELGIKNLGSNAVVFQNASVYREVYALYSTTAVLSDKKKRKDVVEFVRALNKTLEVFAREPEKNGVFEYVAGRVGMDASVVRDVWNDHKWSGRWDGKLIEFLVKEDEYLAKVDTRQTTPRADLEKFLDTSIIDEL